MRIVPLHFQNITALCKFLLSTRLQNFVLLGKQTILIARYTEEELCLAQQQYQAIEKETPEVLQVLKTYFAGDADSNQDLQTRRMEGEKRKEKS